MKKLLSIAAMFAIAATVSVGPASQAQAGHNDRGALIAGLIIGGVTAGIIASQLNNHRHYQNGHYQYRQQYYVHRQQRVRFGHGQVWHQHVHYCHQRYRSYNQNTNLFLAYSGRYHHCRSPWIQ